MMKSGISTNPDFVLKTEDAIAEGKNLAQPVGPPPILKSGQMHKNPACNSG